MSGEAVANLQNIKDCISVARHVLDLTSHSLIVGLAGTRIFDQNKKILWTVQTTISFHRIRLTLKVLI